METLDKTLLKNINFYLDIDILKKTRKREVVEGRVIFAKIMHTNNKYTLEKIGGFISKDYSTIIHYLKLHDSLFKHDSNYRKKFNLINEKIKPTFFVSQTLRKLKPCYYDIRRNTKNANN
jgi:hypothetical protein